MKNKVILTLLMLGVGTAAYGQTVPEPIDNYVFEVFAPGVNTASGTPVVSATFPNTPVLITCNLAFTPPSTPPVNNPGKARMDDPLNVGKQCEIVITPVIQGLAPAVGYLATLTAKGATTTSARSAASNPFNRKIVVAPGTPTGLTVLP